MSSGALAASDIAGLTVGEAVRRMARDEFSPRSLVEACVQRVDALDDGIVAWAYVDRSGALRRAEELQSLRRAHRASLPLFGIPVGVKDIIDVAGMPAEGNCAALSGRVATEDATVVSRLREAGAIILGKTQTTELALFDPPKTRNPWNLAHTPGGSSSGSAAAVASRMCLAAIGTQTGGSTLRPASYNGIVGLKPSLGRISTFGIMKLSDELDHVGIFAPDVDDATRLLNILSGPDLSDPCTLDELPPMFGTGGRDYRPTRFAAAWASILEAADPEMQEHYNQTVRRLEDAGVVVERVTPPPGFDEIPDLFQVLLRVGGAAHHRELCASHPGEVGADVRRTVELGLATTATEYADVLRRQRELRRAFSHALLPYDALLTPAAPGQAPLGILTGSPVMQVPWSFLGFPCLSIPSGLSAQGLPLGLQIISAPAKEEQVVLAAMWCEDQLGCLPPLRLAS